MKLEIKSNGIKVIRENSDPKYYGDFAAKGESNLLHAVKNELNKQGYDLIKKRMWKDGHLVDDRQQYLRTRKKGAGKEDLCIYSSFFALRGANEDFNKGEVFLSIERNIFDK